MWGQSWGTMVWGITAVPSLGPVGLAFLIGLLIGAAFILQRRRLTQAAATCAVIAVAVVPVVALAMQVSLPHSFSNGTVADATEVNANFEALRDAHNETAGRFLESGHSDGPLPSLAGDCTFGDIELWSGGFEPQGKLFARGQVLNILPSYNTLFALIGTKYGGNGITTFALPDLEGMGPDGTTYVICVLGSSFPSGN